MSEWAIRRSEDERKRWELVRDDAVHGALEWEGMARRRAVLSAGGAGWRIGRAGVLRASFDITDAATGTAVGTFALGGCGRAARSSCRPVRTAGAGSRPSRAGGHSSAAGAAAAGA